MSIVPSIPSQIDLTPAQGGFWPAISSQELRSRYRLDTTVADRLLLAELQSAVIVIDTQLADWRTAQEALGIHTLAEVPPRDGADSYSGEDKSGLVADYQTAVYARAHAHILRAMRRYDLTREGQAQAEEAQTSVGDYLRESHVAVRRVLGLPGLTVELI